MEGRPPRHLELNNPLTISGTCIKKHTRNLLKALSPNSGIQRSRRVPYRPVEDVNMQTSGPRSYTYYPFSVPSSYRSQLVATRWTYLALLILAVAFLLTSTRARSQTIFPGTTTVGQTSLPQTVTITITGSGTASAPSALTEGIANLDYQLVSGGTCASGVAYSAGQQCTVIVDFKPLYPGVRSGAVVITSGGLVLGSAGLSAVAAGPLSVLVPGTINTIAGNYFWVYGGDGQAANTSSIFLPLDAVEDAAGNVYLSDSNNQRIRRVDGVTGLISTVAGTGSSGYSGDGGPATSAMINAPSGLALDGAGNLYFSDAGNQIVRRIDAVSGVITTVAGVPQTVGYTGNGGRATSATLSAPQGLAFDASGNLYIADSANNVIRMVAAGTGTISTVAGTSSFGYNGDGGQATTEQLYTPWSVTVGADGSLYIADLANNRIRKVSTGGTMTTAVGSGTAGFAGDGSSGQSAQLDNPAGVVLDPGGNIYIADSGNNRVRKVSGTTGIITTIAGNADESFGGDGGPAPKAGLYGPYSVFVDQTGDLLISDLFHNRVREISSNVATLPEYATIRVGKVSPPQAQGYENDGNGNLLFPSTNFEVLNNSSLDPTTTTCDAGATLAIDVQCNLGVDFAPTVTGMPVYGTLTINSNAANTPTVINLSGNVLSVNPTSISLTSSTNPSVVGASVTFTATVTSSNTALTGSITFYDGATQLCSVAISANAGSCTTSALTLGQHNITADYGGDSQDAAVNSSVLIQIVKQQSVLVFTPSPNPVVVGATLTLSATATAPTGTPTGNVIFYDTAGALGSAILSSAGVATIQINNLPAGTYNMWALYQGDSTNTSATSNYVSEVVQLATSGTTLTANTASATVGTPVTFTATVTSKNGTTPTGTVQFAEGSTVLGNATLNASGVATLTISTLPPGTNPIVATYGGDTNNSTSASAAFTETTLQIGTVVTLASNANPAHTGQIVTFTANVAMAAGSTADGAITGQVTFTDGIVTLGVVAVDVNGNATVSVSTLAVGTHNIVASYAGNTNYASSSSSPLAEVIQISSTTTVGSSTNNSTLAGEPATLNATVTSATGIPTGTVTFYDGATILGTAPVNAQGVATLTTSTLSVGTHTLKAVYGGDPNYTGSTSATWTQTISLATTGVTLSGPTTPVDAGNPVNLSSTLTTNGVAPTGTLTLRDGNTVIATQTVTAAGTFPFSTTTLSIGTHTLTMTYSGDANNATAVSPAITVVVQQAQTTTALTSSSNPSPLGQPVTLTATVSADNPGISGSVTFEDGGAVIGTGTVSGGIATLTTSAFSVGMNSLTAVYSGDTNHATSTSPVLVEQITEVSTENLSSSINPTVTGVNVVFTATIAAVGGIIPTGTVVFADGGTTIGTSPVGGTGSATFATSTLSVGSHTITATYSGDKNDAPATATLIETIQNASTQISLTASSNPATYGTPETFTATILSNGGIATGTVTFTDGGTAIGTGTLNASGVATLTTSTLAPGAHTIVANYPGDGKASASVSTPLTISVQELTTVAVTSSANPALTLAPIVLTATVNNAGVGVPTGTVTFTDGSATLGTATLNSSGVATLSLASLAAGNHAIQASYAGDTNNFASVSPALSQAVQLRPTTTAVSSTQTNPNDAQQVTLIGTVGWTGPVSPTGTITFTTGTTVIGTSPLNGSGQATINIELQSTGESVVATYNADTVYAGSASAITQITGGGVSQFSILVAPGSMTLQSSQHGVVTVTLTSVHNFTDTMQIGCLGLPVDATCTFSADMGVLAADGTMVGKLTIDTGDPLGAGATAKNERSGGSGVLLAFLPAGLLACLIFFRSKRRSLPMLILLLAAIAGTLGATGCGGIKINSTPAGTYNFKVTAYGTGTGATETQDVTLIVTP
jgi:hypothetical protein